MTDNLHGLIAKPLEDQVHLFRRYLIGCQECHEFPEHLVLSVGFHDPLQLFLGNSFYLQKLLGMFFHDFQRIKAKFFVNGFCNSWPHTLYRAAGEVS